MEVLVKSLLIAFVVCASTVGLANANPTSCPNGRCGIVRQSAGTVVRGSAAVVRESARVVARVATAPVRVLRHRRHCR